MQPTTIFDDEQLCNSPTMQKLSALARINPINTSDQASVSSSLAEALVSLTEALDNGTILFQNRADEGAFWNLLMTTHMILTQPKPTSAVQH